MVSDEAIRCEHIERYIIIIPLEHVTNCDLNQLFWENWPLNQVFKGTEELPAQLLQVDVTALGYVCTLSAGDRPARLCEVEGATQTQDIAHISLSLSSYSHETATQSG